MQTPSFINVSNCPMSIEKTKMGFLSQMMDYTILLCDSLKEKCGDKKSCYSTENKQGRAQETHKISNRISAKIKIIIYNIYF